MHVIEYGGPTYIKLFLEMGLQDYLELGHADLHRDVLVKV